MRQYLRITPSSVPIASIPFQSPGSGTSFADVKVIKESLFPIAISDDPYLTLSLAPS
jgi:hypothetical protein